MIKKKTDLLIAGQGAAGYSAALYSARYQINTMIIGGEFGGETAIGGMIENYPGIEVDGFDLMMNMKEQVLNMMLNYSKKMLKKLHQETINSLLKQAHQL